MESKVFDLIIVGSGPAGLTAAIYAARYMIDCVVIGPEIGGVATLANDIENWPGYKGSGMELMQKFKEHAESFKVPIINSSVKNITKENDLFTVSIEGKIFQGRTIILAMGTKRRKLEVEGEDDFFGKGVSYCATCDGIFFSDKTVAVVGGSDAAAMAAQMLSQYVKKIYLIYRGEHMRAEPARVFALESDQKIEFLYKTNITKITGNSAVEKIILDNGKELLVEGVLIEIGGIPLTGIAKELNINLSENGRIIVDFAMRTNISGAFAAGDITTGSNEFNQIVTAASEGAIAALGSFNYLKKNRTKK